MADPSSIEFKLKLARARARAAEGVEGEAEAESLPEGVTPDSPLAKALREQPGDVVETKTPEGEALRFTRGGERVLSPADVEQRLASGAARTREEGLRQLLAFAGGGGGKFMRLLGGKEAMAESEAAQAEYPKTAIAGALTPAILSGGANVAPAVAGRFGTSVPAVAQALLQGPAQRVGISAATQGIAGLAGAEPGERIGGALEGTAYGTLGGLFGEGLGAAGAGIAKAATPVTGAMADLFKRYGLEAGRKLMQGKSTLRAQSKKPLPLEAVEEAYNKGALRFGRDVIETADRTLEAKQAAGERLGGVIDELADLGAPGVDLRNLARRLQQEYGIAVNDMDAASAAVFRDKLNQIQGLANVRMRAGQNPFQASLRQAETWKRNWQSEADKAGAYSKMDPREPAEAKAKVASLLRQANEGVAGAYAQSVNRPELLDEFLAAKSSFGKLADANDFVQKAASKQVQSAAGPGVGGAIQNILGRQLTAGAIGAAVGGGGSAAMGMDPMTSMMFGGLAAAGALNKYRGDSSRAVSWLAASKGIRAVGPVLSSAASGLPEATFPLGTATGAHLAKQNAFRTLSDYLGKKPKDEEEMSNQAYIRQQVDPAAQPD